MNRLNQRIRALEQRRRPERPLEVGRAYFEDAVASHDGEFSEHDRHLARQHIAMLTQRLAWLRRFHGEPNLAQVFAEFGYQVPENGEGFISATTIMLGDGGL